MTYFNEENSVEQLVLLTLTDRNDQWRIAEVQTDHLNSYLTQQISSLKWCYMSTEELQCQHSAVLVKSKVPCRQCTARHRRFPS